MPSSDQRRSPRFPPDGHVQVVLTAAREASQPMQCSTADISLRGVRLELDFPLSKDSPVELQLLLAGKSPGFRHGGRVAWCRPLPECDPPRYTAGVEFTTPPGPVLDEWRVAFLRMFE